MVVTVSGRADMIAVVDLMVSFSMVFFFTYIDSKVAIVLLP